MPNENAAQPMTFSTYSQLAQHKAKQLLTLLEEDPVMLALVAATANRGRELANEAGVECRQLPTVTRMMIGDAMRGSTTWVESDPNYDAWDNLNQIMITINTDNV